MAATATVKRAKPREPTASLAVRPLSADELRNLTISPVEVDTGTSKFDLTLLAQESSSGLEFTLEYNTDLFSQSTADRLLNHFQSVLRSIVEDPNQRISEVPLLDSKERAVVDRDLQLIANAVGRLRRQRHRMAGREDVADGAPHCVERRNLRARRGPAE